METVRPSFAHRELRRYAALLVAFMIPLVVFGAWLFAEYQKENRVIVKGVYVKNIRLGGIAPEQAEDVLEQHFSEIVERQITLTDGEFHLSFSPANVGIQFDGHGLAQEAFAFGHRGSLLKRCWERLSLRVCPKRLHQRLFISRGRLNGFYLLLEEQVNKEPTPARVYLFQNGRAECTPSGEGRRLNRKRLQKEIENGIWSHKNSIKLPIDVATPQLTSQQVEAWSLDNIMGIFSTRFNPKNVDRSHNVAIASSSLQNVLVLPGHTFSFNKIVGARVSEQGYREAPVIIKNKLTPGIGGGVCQVSSTLYNALLLAGFSSFERRNHSLPSAYVSLGRDATVVDGVVDFTFVNTNSTPVLLATDFNPSGSITIAVLGHKEHLEEIRLETVVKKKIPFTRVEVSDPTLAEGERKVEEEGKEGYIVELWRIRRGPDGKVLREKVNRSYYPPVPELIKLGPLPAVVPQEVKPEENP